MNQRLAERAIFQARIRPSEKLVLLALLDHWSRKNPRPCPGISRLMCWTGLARQTVIDTIAELVRIGALPEPARGPRGMFIFEVSGLVNELDRYKDTPPVRESDRYANQTGLVPGPDRSKSTPSTGKVKASNQLQLGSIRSEESKEESKEESNTPPGKPAGSHQVVIATWSRLYENVRGCTPVVNGRNAKAAKDLLRQLPLAEVLDVLERAFSDREWAGKFGELHDVAPNRWRGNAKANGTGARLGARAARLAAEEHLS